MGVLNIAKSKFQLRLFLFLVFFLLFSPFLTLAANSILSDDVYGSLLTGSSTVAKNSGYGDFLYTIGTIEAATGILRIVFIFLGAAFFLIIVYAGWRWMTASGNEEQITKAKQSLIQASIGFGLVVLAYAITFLVITVLGSGAQYNTGVTPAEDCPYGVC